MDTIFVLTVVAALWLVLSVMRYVCSKYLERSHIFHRYGYCIASSVIVAQIHFGADRLAREDLEGVLVLYFSA